MIKTHIPISLLAFADAGYKTVHFLFPVCGSSEAKTLPVAVKNSTVELNYLRASGSYQIPRNVWVSPRKYLLKEQMLCQASALTSVSHY